MKDRLQIKCILILGIGGGLAQLNAKLLRKKFPKAKIIGVDTRPLQESIKNYPFEYRQMKYTRGNFERLFRDENFDTVIHLARMGQSNSNLAQRLDVNLMGTKRILDLSLKSGVKKIIILSTYHVYGAYADNPVFISEDYPLRASVKYPELRDVVEMDQLATNWMWKHQQEIETIIFRPCAIIGPQLRNTITQYLTTSYAPICMDFNPMFQFIHEYDMAKIISNSLEKVPTGIYNIAHSETVSLKTARELVGSKSIPIPSFLMQAALKVTNNPLWSLPKYFIDYIQYACIIDNRLIKSFLGEEIFNYTTREALELNKID